MGMGKRLIGKKLDLGLQYFTRSAQLYLTAKFLYEPLNKDVFDSILLV